MSQKSRLVLFTLAVFLFVSAFAAGEEIAGAPTHVVISPVANMYRAATLDSDVVSQAIYSTNVFIVSDGPPSTDPNWVHVRTPDAYTGWMQVNELKPLRDSPYAAGGQVVRVSQRSANVYREPDVTAHAPLLNLPWETRLEVINEKVNSGERWLKVRLPDGRQGYVQKGDVSSDFTPLTIDQTIALARNFLGITYTWGGTSSFGYDCSGFVQMLVRQRGIIMPRDADEQAAWSGVAPVQRKDLQPGDLLYFGSGPDKITHTGMYIGSGEFIHDTTNTHPMVQISKLDAAPWTTLLVAARRVKQQPAQDSNPQQEARSK